ncbi:alpha-1,6-glucosidase domain-containing protein [Corynebacterium diphtheriae]
MRDSALPRYFRALVAVISAISLVGVGLHATQPTARADEELAPAVVAGTFQKNLGCSKEWEESCDKTRMKRKGNLYATTLKIPEGDWKFKVVLNGDWGTSYGAPGFDENNIPLKLTKDTELEFSFDPLSHRIGLKPVGLDDEKLKTYDDSKDKDIVGAPFKHSAAGKNFYFVLTDRFQNGNPENDRGGAKDGDKNDHGFDPTDKAYYHGGDIEGLIKQLDYIKNLGTTALWLTPSFKNRAVQCGHDPKDCSSGYHGYWITDFTQIDPHLGSNDDLKRLIEEAHNKGIKVYFDIVANHTADLIQLAGGNQYISEDQQKYKDVDGKEFLLKDYAGKKEFPELNDFSFPYKPIRKPEDNIIVPKELNDVHLYHNRGNNTWEGESVIHGDFEGLDDLMTEHPKVVSHMIEAYNKWAGFGLDGFRIDSVKHVNMEFWKEWTEAVKKHAKESRAGEKEDFFMFGEVFNGTAESLSPFVRDTQMDAALDFAFHYKALDFAKGQSTQGLHDLFYSDDWYTTTRSDATNLPTFLGNHDVGRIGYLLRDNDDKVQRDVLAHQLMFLTRGQPVVYYGDEQGFAGTGDGKDKQARQDMFGTQVDEFKNEQDIYGKQLGSDNHFKESGELYGKIKQLAELRTANKALATGAQIERWETPGPGIYAFSRVDRDEKQEYLVALNNSHLEQTATPAPLTPNASFTKIYGEGPDKISPNLDGTVNLKLPRLSAVVYKVESNQKVSGAVDGTGLSVKGQALKDNAPIMTNIGGKAWSETSFAWRELGTEEWKKLGTDTGQNARVFHDVRDLKPGTIVEYRTVTVDADNNKTASTGWGVVGVDLGVDTAALLAPSAVVAGDFTKDLGCTGGDQGNWDPACAKTELKSVGGTDWHTVKLNLKAGEHQYKIAVAGSWNENYGQEKDGDRPNDRGYHNGKNVKFNLDREQEVQFFYNPVTNEFFNSVEHGVITLPGTMDGALNCPKNDQKSDEHGNWGPACLATLMTKTGDHIYEFSSPKVPTPGNYDVKVAYGLEWGNDWGPDGHKTQRNYDVKITDSGILHYRWDENKHELTWNITERSSLDLQDTFAHWLDDRTIAVPRSQLRDASPSDVEGLLVSVSDGKPSIKSGKGASSQADAKIEEQKLHYVGQIGGDLLARNPHLDGMVTFRFKDEVQKDKARELLQGGLGFAVVKKKEQEPVSFTGVQIPGVLDAHYAADARDAQLGVHWKGDKPTVSLWAPTAKNVKLKLFGEEGSLGNGEDHKMDYDKTTGVWSVEGKPDWKNHAYQFEVEVYAPSTHKVEHNLTTDPYSVGLSMDSKYSVMLNLNDPELKPADWGKAMDPIDPVDRMIYELHVRDFSASDKSMDQQYRGKYKAFTQSGSKSVMHLKELADAGLNSVHLLPTNDIATIPEDPAKAKTPAITSTGAADTQQQEAVAAVQKEDAFNWGYDPYHYMAPEGSYATKPDAKTRVKEYREMVKALNGMGLHVVSDQVYNHAFQGQQDEKSVLDKVVPGYYHRLMLDGKIANSTCCANLATEHVMMEKLMTDSVKSWAKNYHIDGFRFDLMGHHSAANMINVQTELSELTVEKDDIDGSSIYLYGEGWNFGEVENNQRFIQATQENLAGTGIGTFNDGLRNGVHGHEGRTQGFGTGLAMEGNGTDQKDQGHLRHLTDIVRVGMAGNLQDFKFNSKDGYKRGGDIWLDGKRIGYGLMPQDTVNYVDAHDNQTLYDLSVLQLPQSLSMDDRVRMNTVQLATVALGQSPAFWHAGTEIMRSKSLDRDSYNSGDHFNKLDLSMQEHNFGVGLPIAEKNDKQWELYKGFLNDEHLKAKPEDLKKANDMAKELMTLRKDNPLMRLGDVDQIQEKVTFPANGPDAQPGLIVMNIDDTKGEDRDAKRDGILIVINSSPKQIEQTINELEGLDFTLEKTLAEGVDKETQKGSTWNKAEKKLTIPARTVAVFERTQNEAAHHDPQYPETKVFKDATEDVKVEGPKDMPETAKYSIDPAVDGVSVDEKTGALTVKPTAIKEDGLVVTVTVKYSDGSEDRAVAKFVTDTSIASMYDPTYEETKAESADKKVTIKKPMSGEKSLPEDAHFTLEGESAKKATIDGFTGEITVEPLKDERRLELDVKVTYADESVDMVKAVVVAGDTLADQHDPKYADTQMEKGTKTVIAAPEGMPENIKYELAEPQDGVTVRDDGSIEVTTDAESLDIKVKVTYSDKSTDTAVAHVTTVAQTEQSVEVTPGTQTLVDVPGNGDVTVTVPQNSGLKAEVAGNLVTLTSDGSVEGHVTVTYQVKDADGKTTTGKINVQVAKLAEASWPKSASVAAGDSTVITPEGVDTLPYGTTLSVGSLPEWATFDQTTGQLTLTADEDTTDESTTATITVAYPDGLTKQYSVALSVGAATETTADQHDPQWESVVVNGDSVTSHGVDVPADAEVSVDKLPEGWTATVTGSDVEITPAAGSPAGHVIALPVTVRYADGTTDTAVINVLTQPDWSTSNKAPKADSGMFYQAGPGAPAWVRVNNDGSMTWADNAPEGTHEIPVIVTKDGVHYLVTASVNAPKKVVLDTEGSSSILGVVVAILAAGGIMALFALLFNCTWFKNCR